MLPVTVPTSQKTPLTELATLDNSGFLDLLSLLQQTPPATSVFELWTRLVTPGRTTSREAGIVIAVMNVRGLAESQRASVEEVSSAVADDVREKKWIDVELAQRLRERLVALLPLDVIVLTTKAADLVNASEHAFDSARILTDVRPLFVGEGVGIRSPAAIVMHTLKIVIRDNDDLFTSMTSKELRELQFALARAIRKEEHLREQLRSTGLSFVDDDPFVPPGDSQ